MGDSDEAAPQPPAADKPQAKTSPLPPDAVEDDGADEEPEAEETTKDQPDSMFEG